VGGRHGCHSKKEILLLAAPCFFAGCAATGPAFTDAPPPGTKSLVYIYRMPDGEMITAQGSRFDVDGKRVAALDSGGYTFFYASPGHYEIKQIWPFGPVGMPSGGSSQNVRLPMDLKAGEIHYFRLGKEFDNQQSMNKIRWAFYEVPGEIARPELVKENFQPPDKNSP
jgi:hypothetical protein